MATMKSDGGTIDFVPTANVTSGDVVKIGSIIGIANRDIPANTLGSVAIEGVVEMPKAAATVFAAGAAVYWSTASSLCTTSTSDTLAGFAVAAPATNATSVVVKLDRA